MENKKLAYIFTNGVSDKLVVIFHNPSKVIDTEVYNERVLNEVLIPQKLEDYYFTEYELDRYGFEKDEDGEYNYVIKVYDNSGQAWYLDDDLTFIKYVDNDDILEWLNHSSAKVVELD